MHGCDVRMPIWVSPVIYVFDLIHSIWTPVMAVPVCHYDRVDLMLANASDRQRNAMIFIMHRQKSPLVDYGIQEDSWTE